MNVVSQPVNPELFMSHAVCFEIAHDLSGYASASSAAHWPNQKWWIDDQCRRFNTYVGAGIGVPVFPY